MIDYKLFRFASAPFTGVEWFVRAAQLAGMGAGFGRRAIEHFDETQTKSNVLRVALVRHPCNWLGACWEFLCCPDRNVGNGVLKFGSLRIDTFNGFVMDYLDKCPGEVGRVQLSYDSDTCMRFEDLPWAFLEFVDSLGVDDDMKWLVRELKAPRRPFLNLRKDLSDLVVKEEERLCERYDYY